MMTTKTIHTFFNRLFEEKDFSGAVLIADSNGIILHEGYGVANYEDSTPVTADSIFDIGSISKQFTATAILHLEAQGLLNVDDPITQYLHDVPPNKTGITLHQLLTHSAGFIEEHAEDDLAPLNREQALQAIFSQTLGFTPGETYAYSNSGYTLLAAIIEGVSGQPYTNYLHQTFFEPQGLNNTGFYNDPWDGKLVANGYFNEKDQGNPAEWPGPYWGVIGNGGVLSTVEDLYRWWQAIRNHAVLPPAQTAKFFTRHIEEFARSYYGYGWTLQETPFGDLITHNGGGIGGNSDFAYYEKQDLLMIIASNRIVIRTDAGGNPIEVELPATKARSQLAFELFG
jgi:CubicO group peptidase (beta-lactamase class C family)